MNYLINSCYTDFTSVSLIFIVAIVTLMLSFTFLAVSNTYGSKLKQLLCIFAYLFIGYLVICYTGWNIDLCMMIILFLSLIEIIIVSRFANK